MRKMGNREGKMEHRQEKGSQTGQDKRDGSSQVEKEDTAQARAEAQMYEQPGLDDWMKLAVTRREALETVQQENEELHIKLFMMEEEKELAERERDYLREEAEQAQGLAKIVKSLVTMENEGEGQSGHGPGAADGRPAGARKRSRDKGSGPPQHGPQPGGHAGRRRGDPGETCTQGPPPHRGGGRGRTRGRSRSRRQGAAQNLEGSNQGPETVQQNSQ